MRDAYTQLLGQPAAQVQLQLSPRSDKSCAARPDRQATMLTPQANEHGAEHDIEDRRPARASRTAEQPPRRVLLRHYGRLDERTLSDLPPGTATLVQFSPSVDTCCCHMRCAAASSLWAQQLTERAVMRSPRMCPHSQPYPGASTSMQPMSCAPRGSRSKRCDQST